MSEKADLRYAELKELCESPLPKSAVGAFNWTSLLAILPVVLAMFVQDADLSARLVKLVELIQALFTDE